MTRTCDVAVVGGGIGGLTLAASLSQKSISVQIFEQDSELREIGAGIAIGGNATRLLQGLGIGLAQVANMPPALEFRCWRDGALLWSHPIGDWYAQEVGAPLLTLHRATLQHLLAAAVPPDCIQFNHRLFGQADEPVMELEAVRRYRGGKEMLECGAVQCQQRRAHLLGVPLSYRMGPQQRAVPPAAELKSWRHVGQVRQIDAKTL